MAGVNRAAVAVTDTFDVWRVRTNELNTSLNAGTHAKTADTIVWRDDNASFVANVVTANTVTLARDAAAATITVASTLAADATKASIQTTGGIKADLASRFGAAVDVTGALTVGGSSTLGDAAATDTITLTGRVASLIDTATSITYDIGSSDRKWKTYYGQGIDLTGNTTFAADATIDITAGHLTKPSLKITDAVQAGASAKLVDITSNSADTAARVLFKVTNDNVAAVATTAICAQSDGGRGFYAVSTLGTGLPALEIASSHTTANAAIVTASSLTSGSAVQVTSAGASRTGHLVHLASTDTGAGSTGDVLHVQSKTTTNTAIIANFANTTTNVMSIMVGGGVKIDGDLDVTGTTTQFRTAAAVVNDKTLVLGAVGDVRTGATYSVANPAVVTSTAHGLTNGQVIFVVASDATNTGTVAIQSEMLIKVANKTNDTFQATTVAGANINTANESDRTFSWVGPQTDAIVDDAGIYAPGGTGLHVLKWDDTDNYWDMNDSFKINTTTQFLLPKGTSLERPVAATATVAAATPGAMRFNTDTSQFEGVHVGTGGSATFEGFATQNFSTAIAVALG